jgi:hypothetical protein
VARPLDGGELERVAPVGLRLVLHRRGWCDGHGPRSRSRRSDGELGFLGVILVLCLFAAFVGEGFRIAQHATSDFVRITATGLSALIGLQAFFIMAGVLRLLPFTGITLPFMAYGANSLIANYVIVAILLRISDEGATEKRGGELVFVQVAHE